MELIKSKISLDKSWKFTPQVLILIILGIIVILGILFLVWPEKEVPPPKVIPPKERTLEEILKDLSIPEGKKGTVEAPSPEVMESLTAPSKKEVPQVSEEIIKDLTIPK